MTRGNNDALVNAGLVVAALYVFRNQVGAIASGITSAAAEIFGGAAQGAGSAINEGIINPAARVITGDPNATAGGAIFDWLHYTTPTSDVVSVFPSAYRMDYYANIYNARGDLIGFETDEYAIRDARGIIRGYSSFSGSGFGLVFRLANFAEMTGQS